MIAKTLFAALAAASLALPAMAGPFGPFGTSNASAGRDRNFKNEEKEYAQVVKRAAPAATQTTVRDGFTYVGGEAGWQLTPHTLVWAGGRFAHSDKCDHVIRSAKAATPGEIDSSRRSSPG